MTECVSFSSDHTDQPSPSHTKSLNPQSPLLPHRINALREPPVTSRRQVTSIFEVFCDLTVRPSTGPQRQHSVNQRLLVVAQRSNVESHWTAADDEGIRGLSAVNLRQRSHQGHSTVTDLAKLRGLSTSVPRAQAVW